MEFIKRESDSWLNKSFSDIESAAQQVTHLAIGAHQDDLEFMAYHGIAACYKKAETWFAGVTVTNGEGSSLGGKFANLTPQQLGRLRVEEQNKAAELGGYAYQLQLGYASLEIKESNPDNLINDLVAELSYLLNMTQPRVVYLHQPADKHPTHIAVFKASLLALKSLPESKRPEYIYGCEGWRDLDWLSDEDKVALDVSAYPELAQELMLVFKTQISSGKRYDLATLGRRHANATYHDPHSLDDMLAITWAMDLSPLVKNKKLSIEEFIIDKISKFKNEVLANI